QSSVDPASVGSDSRLQLRELLAKQSKERQIQKTLLDGRPVPVVQQQAQSQSPQVLQQPNNVSLWQDQRSISGAAAAVSVAVSGDPNRGSTAAAASPAGPGVWAPASVGPAMGRMHPMQQHQQQPQQQQQQVCN
uniref:Mastermind-like 3 n=1 Tax=Macrostomum lignano TaxID=282301 RepID=A0A1I8HTT0_9PLAT